MKKIELLAPAGNFECLKAAINNGANAIYLGGSLFSARAFANNFNDEEMIEAVKYAHLRNVKIYVTINTLMNEIEIDNAFNKAKFYKDINVDALLVQDLGLFYRIRKELPDFEVHASTQMHIHNLNGVKNAKELGFKRVVVARESSLDFIKEACKQDIEIETFVHGAICVSYSGQCLLSSLTKNRSANKGMCAQCCRLRYELYEDDKKVKTDTDYLLSPKDMYLLENVPELIETGVSSLKIEGRMKSPAYVAYITSVYRKAIDSYYEGKEFKVDKNTLNEIKSLFNRGFTNTYLLNDEKELFKNIRPNHMGVQIGEITGVYGGSALIKLTQNVNQFDGIRIISGNSDGEGMILNKLIVNKKLVSKAFKNEEIEVPSTFGKKGDKVYRTKDFKLEERLNDYPEIKIAINYRINIEPLKPIEIEIYNDDFNFKYQSIEIPQVPIKAPISINNVLDTFNKTGEHPYLIKDIEVKMKDSFISLKVLNEIRRQALLSLDEYRLNSFNRVIKPFKEKELIINQSPKELIEYSFDPKRNTLNYNEVINTKSKYYKDNNFVSDFGGILLNGFKIGSYTLNVTNSYAYEFLLRQGFNNIVLSLELSKDFINKLIEGFEKRNGHLIQPYVFVYGKRELMHIARNPFRTYVKDINNSYLSDGTNKYRIIQRKECIDILEYDTYNNLDLYDEKYLKFKKLNYSDEI